MVKITFPDGSVREYEQGVTGYQIAESISPALARDVVSCGVNGETVELNRPINEDATIALYKLDEEEAYHLVLLAGGDDAEILVLAEHALSGAQRFQLHAAMQGRAGSRVFHL